ncbi:MAG: DNA primase [Acidobacteriota bacterium]|nr:DNA primase [Acidobacteriota bacterium]
MSLGNVHITPELVQAVRDAVDILDIASEHTTLRRAGKSHKGRCPLHKEKTPSFTVDPDRGVFYCFGCSQGGDAIRLHQLLSGDDFPSAMESLAGRYGIPLPTRPGKAGRQRQEEAVDRALEAAFEFFRERLEKSAGPRQYLDRRKIPRELIEAYGIGYAPEGWQNLLGALEKRISVKALEAAGLVARSEKAGGRLYDRFRERLMFPIRNAAGRLVGFGGRALGDDKAKYINTAETSRFRKGTILYGLDLAKKNLRDSRRAILVEGYFDVLGAVAAGAEGVVASMGTALTPEQCRLLARFGDEVVVGYDADTAGIEAGRRALPLLLAEGLGVLRLDLPSGHDPDSLRLESGAEEVLRILGAAPDAVTAEIERLAPADAAREPRLQARAAREIGRLLLPIPDRVLRYGYARQAAERLDIPAELLLRQFGRSPAQPQADRGGGTAGLVRSIEEKLLQLLFQGPDELPPVDDLPPAEAFLDPGLRNIFGVFCDLYREGGHRPTAQAVLNLLPQEGNVVDRAARLLLEETAGLSAGELGEAITRLERRWCQQRLRELSAQIARAQSAGETGQLEQLLGEKTALSRRLHGRPET